MPLGWVIPKIRKVIDQGPTVQDTIPIPGIDHPNIRSQWYNTLEANRYINKQKIDVHSGAVVLDLFIPKLHTNPLIGINYKPANGSRYVDVPLVTVVPDIFTTRKASYPPISYSIPVASRNIDGPFVPTIVDGYQRRVQLYQPSPYTVPGKPTKLIDISTVVVPDVFKLRQNPQLPIPYVIPKSTKLIDVPPFVPQQTYEFKIQKPIQEWYQRLLFKQYIKTPKPWTETIAPILGGNALIACIDTTTSWEDHFLSHAWANIQDQLNAGYPIYIQPSELNGSYQEVFDFGSIISNIIAVVNWNQTEIINTVMTTTTTLETSTDGVVWSAPTVGTSIFAASLRYVRLTMNFVGTSDKALAVYQNLKCLLNVHREQDGGQANVFAADVTGTEIFFNKQFKALDALAVTPLSTVEQKAVYDFAFPVNPTSFKAYLFDSTGARVDGLVTWVARGIF